MKNATHVRQHAKSPIQNQAFFSSSITPLLLTYLPTYLPPLSVFFFHLTQPPFNISFIPSFFLINNLISFLKIKYHASKSFHLYFFSLYFSNNMVFNHIFYLRHHFFFFSLFFINYSSYILIISPNFRAQYA